MTKNLIRWVISSGYFWFYKDLCFFPLKKELCAYQALLCKKGGGLSQVLFAAGALKLRAGGHPVGPHWGGAPSLSCRLQLRPGSMWTETRPVACSLVPFRWRWKLTIARLSSFGVQANRTVFLPASHPIPCLDGS